MTRAVEGAEDDAEQGAADLRGLGVTEADLVVGIATSGRTPYVLGAIEQAKAVGASTVGIACNRPSLLGAQVDLEIALLVGPEVLTGSTRLKSVTATKLVLNMITTWAMVRIGKTYGNLMVDVQTGSEKLRDRARRIVMIVTGLEYEDSDKLLRSARWNTKAAIVMHKADLTYPKALVRLKKADDSVRQAIREDLEPRLKELLNAG